MNRLKLYLNCIDRIINIKKMNRMSNNIIAILAERGQEQS